ncbi:MAG TPA: phenylalanine--tRNA ligase subunit alpha, partial [Acidimicrobiales bacterium]
MTPEEVEEKGLARIAGAGTVEELKLAETEVLGKRSDLSGLNQQLGRMPAEERKDAGRAINAVRQRLVAAVDERRAVLEADDRRQRLEADRLDLTEVVGSFARGHLHLVNQTRRQLEDVFVG